MEIASTIKRSNMQLRVCVHLVWVRIGGGGNKTKILISYDREIKYTRQNERFRLRPGRRVCNIYESRKSAEKVPKNRYANSVDRPSLPMEAGGGTTEYNFGNRAYIFYGQDRCIKTMYSRPCSFIFLTLTTSRCPTQNVLGLSMSFGNSVQSWCSW